MFPDPVLTLRDFLERHRAVAAQTGAGVGTAPGIPDCCTAALATLRLHDACGAPLEAVARQRPGAAGRREAPL